MDRDSLIETWMYEAAQPFEGWDLSYLDGRMDEEQPPWNYMERAVELMQGAASVVDLDTGGGERLLALRPHWPARIVATENYPPNVRLAHERLSPLGVNVVMASSDELTPLPFASEVFDLVLNRHGSFNALELSRTLAHNGTFLTKQVHGLWAHDLLEVFGASPQWPEATPERYVPLLEAAGLTIVNAEDWRGKLHFNDVGALVYYLHAVPWLVPGFDVKLYQENLLGLQKRVEQEGKLAFEAWTYLIEARKLM